MKSWNRMILAATGFAALLLGCGQSPSPAPSSTPAAPAGTAAAAGGGGTTKPVRLAFVTNNSSDFWTIARAGCEKAVEDIKAKDGAGAVTLEFKLPGEGTAAQQRQIIDDLMARGIDGIAISPNDPDNQTEYLNSVAAKCLLITQDSDAAKSNRACYLVAFGYAGWGPGQLEGELARHGWFTIPEDPKLVFDLDRGKVWEAAVARRTVPL